MKKLPAALLLCAGLKLFAQETPAEVPVPEPVPADSAEPSGTWKDSLPKTWKEWMKGLTLDIEAGSHEYPLEIWYPGRYAQGEGYSIRSFYFKPRLAYGKTIADITGILNLEFTADLGAPDPRPGLWGRSAKEAARKPWFTLLVEQDFDYPVSHLFDTKVNFPGLLSAFLHHENNFYIAPEFPENPPTAPMEGKKMDGILEPGAAYSYDGFSLGELRAALGFPLYYLNRYSEKLGFGMNFSLGYTDGYGIGIKADLGSKLVFIPSFEYKETELILSYSWLDFSVILDLAAQGTFKTFSINPEFQYRFSKFAFRLGCDVTGIGDYAAFSPYLGINWVW
jgi:hypothetical protein